MKNLLNEIKAMNKIAGTQLTKEQEIAIIRERLEELNEASMKPPKSVKVGDIAVTKRGKKGKVIAIGSLS